MFFYTVAGWGKNNFVKISRIYVLTFWPSFVILTKELLTRSSSVTRRLWLCKMPWAYVFSRVSKMTLMEKHETTEVAVDHHGSSLLVVSLSETLCLLGIRMLGIWGSCLGHGNVWDCVSDGWFQLGVAQCKGLCSSLSVITAGNITVCLLFPQSASLEFASLAYLYLAICSDKFSLLWWACLTFWSCTLNSFIYVRLWFFCPVT